MIHMKIRVETTGPCEAHMTLLQFTLQTCVSAPIHAYKYAVADAQVGAYIFAPLFFLWGGQQANQSL